LSTLLESKFKSKLYSCTKIYDSLLIIVSSYKQMA